MNATRGVHVTAGYVACACCGGEVPASSVRCLRCERTPALGVHTDWRGIAVILAAVAIYVAAITILVLRGHGAL